MAEYIAGWDGGGTKTQVTCLTGNGDNLAEAFLSHSTQIANLHHLHLHGFSSTCGCRLWRGAPGETIHWKGM